MRLTTNKWSRGETPIIVTDVNGVIIHMNDKAYISFHSIKTGDNLSNTVDINYIRKFSMYDNKIDIIETKNTTYKKAIIKVFGRGLSKFIQICFFNDNKIMNSILLSEKKMLELFSEVTIDKIKGTIKTTDFIQKVIDKIKRRKGYSYKTFNILSEGNDEFYTEKSKLQALAVSSIFMLNEVNYIDSIDISVCKEGDFLNMYIAVSVEENEIKKETTGEQNVCSVFPQISSKVAFISSLCDTSGIEFHISVKNKILSVTFKVRQAEMKQFSFASFVCDSDDEERIERYIEILDCTGQY